MNNEELYEKLTELAYQKSKPFCYSDYIVCPTVTCPICGSDDLMRHLDGVGVEYGTEWIIKEILQEELTPVDLEDAFAQSVEDIYGSTTTVGWGKFDTVTLLKEQDPITWRCALSEYESNEESDGTIVSFDNGSTYYHTQEVEELVEGLYCPFLFGN